MASAPSARDCGHLPGIDQELLAQRRAGRPPRGRRRGRRPRPGSSGRRSAPTGRPRRRPRRPRASAGGSKSARISPFDGEAFLISAISARRPGAAARSRAAREAARRRGGLGARLDRVLALGAAQRARPRRACRRRSPRGCRSWPVGGLDQPLQRQLRGRRRRCALAARSTPSRRVSTLSADQQGGGGVEQHDVAIGAGLAGQQRADRRRRWRAGRRRRGRPASRAAGRPPRASR